MSPRHSTRLALLTLLLTLGPGCASTNTRAPTLARSTAGASNTSLAANDTPASGASAYTSAVRKAFLRAEEAFESDDFLDAIRRFNDIRTRFPYSRYATLAELRIADAYFAQEKFASAIQQYRSFTKLHPNHPKSTYAHFRVSYSFYNQMPEDWWLFPPAYERDLASTRDAERELKYFLRRWGKSEYGERAVQLLRLVRRRLADHEFYVATFYLERDNPRAASRRFLTLLKNYAGLGLDPQALFLLGRCYIELKDTDKAKRALNDLIRVHPGHPLSAKARDYLAEHKL